MAVRFHVTSVLNRSSIQQFGLDWRRMDAARGIAGSRRPEQEGCFLGDAFERDWFVHLNNTGGPVDVWEVRGVDVADLVLSPEGHYYFPGVIPAERLRLSQRDVPPSPGP